MKTFLNQDLINDNYLYSMNNSTITIYKNCIDNQCTCIDVNTDIDYLLSNEYSCNSSSIITIPYTSFTDDIYYRKDFSSILIIFFIFAFFVIWCPLKIMMRFFKRFN